MTYTIIHISISPSYRLRLEGGGYVYVEWHNWLGPTFFRDRACRRQIEDWWENPELCAASNWMAARGGKA